ncbi:MarR family transcriptional regulator [Planococcus antarcticus]|uniref:MarR family transcriptional regulator n=1 Tax=Planococcus antarcticus TaxID=161360 RepID=UPI0009F2CC19|nr:MarR family transcriptional regulator [Planococcus antarcticus]
MKKVVIFCTFLVFLVLFLQACSNDNSKVEEKKPLPKNEPLSKIEGNWEGAIQVPNQPLPIVVAFDGQQAAISIPVQGITNFPLTAIDFKDPAIHFEMTIQNQQLVFDGTLQQGTITGTYIQQGQAFPFELIKAVTATEEVGAKAEIDVAGRSMTAFILTPQGDGPFPVMLMLSGSGPTDKDGNSPVMAGKNNSLKMVAEALAEGGISTIRYDKRSWRKCSTGQERRGSAV